MAQRGADHREAQAVRKVARRHQGGAGMITHIAMFDHAAVKRMET